ncbi:MAG: hypothetical protein CVU91_02115 [Firmicutes bacterium HGW-Firmicutes-16]|nr:MAG: hypothetical protein CVU91_02115 [Firmicutes bacterium HGW-Firmicutes-16]
MKAFVIVILILTVLLLIPLGVDCGYSGGKLVFGIRLGFFNVRLYPGKLTHQKRRTPKKKSVKKKQRQGDTQKEKVPLDRKELFDLIKTLKVLARLRRKLHVDYLRIRYTFATDDPFNTAMGFGLSSSAMGAVMPLIENAFDIGERDIGTSFDFLSDRPVFDCWLTLTIQVWEVFYIALAFGTDYLKFNHKRKREDRIRKE